MEHEHGNIKRLFYSATTTKYRRHLFYLSQLDVITTPIVFAQTELFWKVQKFWEVNFPESSKKIINKKLWKKFLTDIQSIEQRFKST